jgi:hypothetical protein
MDLPSMKRTKVESKEYHSTEVAPASPDVDEYPYGLSVTLEKECLEKLGLDVDDFSIDSKADMVCMAEVTGVHENASKHNTNASITLQITNMALKVQPKEEKANLKALLSVIKGSGA